MRHRDVFNPCQLWHRLRNQSRGKPPVAPFKGPTGRTTSRGGALMRLVWVAAIACATMACAIAVPSAGLAQRAPDLRKPAGKEWLTIGGDWGNTRYSTLAQINRNNVKTLKGAWVVHLGSGLGAKYSMEGTPIVKDGVMYFATGNDDVFALDARTGALIWEHRSHVEQNINTVCCGWDNRGLAIGDGRVYLGRLDGTFEALDVKTGKRVWQSTIGKWQDGYTITTAPTYYKG